MANDLEKEHLTNYILKSYTDRCYAYDKELAIYRNYLAHSINTEGVPELIEQWSRLRQMKEAKELETAEWKAVEKAYTKHLEWRFSYPEKVFSQQMRSSMIITVLLIILILSGLLFAFFQLYKAIELGNLASLQTQIAIETAGRLSIGSSIVGAIVLVISLVFFYLYLRYVFEVKFPIPPHVSLIDTDALKIQNISRKASLMSVEKNRSSSQSKK